ncbi:phospholipase [Verticiella sediminum]|uniref:Phospholipase n=1 Tax=Verticiella sediminum TaxID=1247510 RepID=A0A556ACM3_9BURK|nr:AAA domain-containing protein [Verticiella sediminum]TSH90629.1 phospholipase [Verticiella sediminum]
MDGKALAYARYWRNSLADADFGKGALSHADAEALSPFTWLDGQAGRLDEDVVQACFAGEPEEAATVEIMLRPQVYRARLVHGNSRLGGAPEVVTPLVTPAALARDGRVFPLPGTVIPRDLLEPQDTGIYTIGELQAQDTHLTQGAVPGVDDLPRTLETADGEALAELWAAYTRGCLELLGSVCPGWPDPQEDDYQLAPFGYWVKAASNKGYSRNVRQLYDHLARERPQAPLFERYASEHELAPEASLPPNAMFSERLAHSSDRYPLAPAQRAALSHFLLGRHGDILAVNGPPGTGKTTLLLSVVATRWARAALAGDDPPVILAASTNNQAVTNIIDAFGSDFAEGSGPLAGRWLPEVASFGAYFPSSSAAKRQSVDAYQTKDFFQRVESRDYVERARTTYLAAASQAFPDMRVATVEDVVAALRRSLESQAAMLAQIDDAWRHREELRQRLQGHTRIAPADLEQRRQQAQREHEAAQQVRAAWERHLAQEPLLRTLLSAIIPTVKRARLAAARHSVMSLWPGDPPQKRWNQVADIDADVAQLVNRTLRARTEVQNLGGEYQIAERRFAEAQARWEDILGSLGFDGDSRQATLAEVDAWCDRHLRFHMFRLTTHYWEGRWLMSMAALLPELEQEAKKRGAKTVKERWRRRMMLTPCVVLTFFRLPEELKARRREGSGYADQYLYDFADLLIVDEAGQVLPEVAGASFALAKQALVIGDTLQIPPIWSIPRSIDIGNLQEAGLLGRSDDVSAAYDQLASGGKLAASGSVMRIAQVASRWHADADLARGLFLYEHRRCYDDIIQYSNQLCYRGKLLPLRGKRPPSAPEEQPPPLPAMGYLHIDGIAVKCTGGSRCNPVEADTIAAWLCEHSEVLQARYGKPLHDIVGVISPFAGQVRTIRQACRQLGITVDGEHGLTIGTVHALQGAARPVILFSPVYSKHADGQFIDKDSSLLNVAVSRAQDAFLVFGDMDVFTTAPASTPRGRLASILFADEANALRFAAQPRKDLEGSGATLRQLLDAPEHDPYLLEILQKAQHEVHIVTPWIRPGCVEEIGALEAMSAAVRRGVRVNVYADVLSNTHDRDPAVQQAKREAFDQQVALLRSRGIEPVGLRQVHSKLVIADGTHYCVGSFNWFSARRDVRGARSETSLAYQGAGLEEEIEVQRKHLAGRAVRTPPESACGTDAP